MKARNFSLSSRPFRVISQAYESCRVVEECKNLAASNSVSFIKAAAETWPDCSMQRHGNAARIKFPLTADIWTQSCNSVITFGAKSEPCSPIKEWGAVIQGADDGTVWILWTFNSEQLDINQNAIKLWWLISRLMVLQFTVLFFKIILVKNNTKATPLY